MTGPFNFFRRPSTDTLKPYTHMIIGTRKTKDDLYHEIFERRGINPYEWQKEDLRIYMGDGTKPELVGFEQVLGRKFGAFDCFWCCKNCEGIHKCYLFQLKSETIQEIQAKDIEIDDTKIDTHPRYFIREEMMYYIPEIVPTLLMDFDPRKSIPFRQALFKLELIL